MKITALAETDSSVRSLSSGEVFKAETLNFKSKKPVRGGLICEEIFGSSRPHHCQCGKLHHPSDNNRRCDVCNVIAGNARLRAELCGHVELNSPYVPCMSLAALGHLLGIGKNSLKDITVGKRKCQLLESDEGLLYQEGTEKRYTVHVEANDKNAQGTRFAPQEEFKTSTYGLYSLLKLYQIDGIKTVQEHPSRNYDAYRQRNYSLYDFFNFTMLVGPAMYRPVTQTIEGTYMSHPRNELYKSIILQSNRIEAITEQFKDPEFWLIGESCVLQNLIDKLHLGGYKDTSTGRDLPGILDGLTGKQGMFRENLLGKRIDYSGRSVIAAGPDLPLNKLGVPLAMCYELYKPHLLHKLENDCHLSARDAMHYYETKHAIVYDQMDQVLKENWIMMNRQPSLHRYSVQMFKPVVSTGKQIQVPPMICAPYNADFDGDQVALHVPLSDEAREEAERLLSPEHNILGSMDGQPLLAPSHEMIIGIYQMSRCDGEVVGYDNTISSLQCKLDRKDILIWNKLKYYIDGKCRETSAGRMLLEEVFEVEITERLDKKKIKVLISDMYDMFDNKTCLVKLKNLQALGFEYSTKGGLSLCIDDFTVPSSKWELFDQGELYADKQDEAFARGEIIKEVAYNNKIRNWDSIVKTLENQYLEEVDDLNPLYQMYITGSRVSLSQLRQLIVAKGLFTLLDGTVMENPIKESLYEGVSVQGCFLSCSGSRKSLGDKKFLTPISGFLTRQLVSAMRDILVTSDDCGCDLGVIVEPELAVGKVSVETGELITSVPSEPTEVFSVITCTSTEDGVCVKCAGIDPSTRKMHTIGTNIGCIAGQSLGEPGTQMSLRTFHTSGAAELSESDKVIKSPKEGIMSIDTSGRVTKMTLLNGNDDPLTWLIEKDNCILNVEEGQKISKGEIIAGFVDTDVGNLDLSSALPLLMKAIGASNPGKPSTPLVARFPTVDGVVRLVETEDEWGFMDIDIYVIPETENTIELKKKWKVTSIRKNLVTVADGQRVCIGDKLNYGVIEASIVYNRTLDLQLAGKIFIKQLDDLFKDNGMTISPIHFECVFRSMTNTVILESGKPGLRTHESGEIVAKGINSFSSNHPSWLKSLGYGYVPKRLAVAVQCGETSYDLGTERVITGSRIIQRQTA